MRTSAPWRVPQIEKFSRSRCSSPRITALKGKYVKTETRAQLKESWKQFDEFQSKRFYMSAQSKARKAEKMKGSA